MIRDKDMRTIDAECTVDTGTGVTYEPWSIDGGIGYKVTAPDGRVEYVMLVPSSWHDINPDNGAIGDTFLWHATADEAARWDSSQDNPWPMEFWDAAHDVTYVNHFPGTPIDD